MRKTDKDGGWLSRQYRRMPFFAQCLLTYLLVMGITFSAVYSVSVRARGVARQSYLDERRYALTSSAESLARQIANFRAIPLSLQRSNYYMQLRLLGPDAFQNRHYYALSVLREHFALQCNLLEIENTSFIYFQRNGALVTGVLFSVDAEAAFKDAVRIDGMTAAETAAMLADFPVEQTFLSARRVSGNAVVTGDYLIFISRPQYESAVFCMMLRADAIERLFRLDEMPEGTTLRLTDTAGQTLYAYHPEAEDGGASYERIGVRVSGQLLEAELGIPSRYFDELSQPMEALTRAYIIAAVCVGTLMSLLFSLANLLPVRRLLRIASPGAPKKGAGNELYALDRSIRRSLDENSRLRTQMDDSRALLRSNLLARLLAQDALTAADTALALEHLPQLAGACRVLCLRVSGGDEADEAGDFLGFHAMERARALFPSGELCVQMRRDLFALLLRDEDAVLSLAVGAARALREDLSAYGATLAAGVSEPLAAPDRLRAAYLHAQFCLRYVDDAGELSAFVPGEAEREESFRLLDLSHFQSAVLDGEEEAAQAVLDRLLEASSSMRWIQDAARFLLDSVCDEMNLPRSARTSSLRAYTASVALAISAKRAEHADMLASAVLTYLNENYADASLSTDSVAAHFGISKSYLYRTLKESVGMSPGEKLEQIRMTHANRLLYTTQMSVAGIAAACGYNSSNTFYKAYKKCYGRSPNAARGSNTTE